MFGDKIMQFKIILFLLAFIFAIIGVFGLKEIKELKASNKALETQINAVSKQNELNKQDIAKRNEEIAEAILSGLVIIISSVVLFLFCVALFNVLIKH